MRLNVKNEDCSIENEDSFPERDNLGRPGESFGLDGVALGIDRQFATAAIGGGGEEAGKEVSSWCFLRIRKLTPEKVRAIRSAMAMGDPLDSDDGAIFDCFAVDCRLFCE